MKSNLPSKEVPFSVMALPRPSSKISDRQACGFAGPVARTGSGAAGSAEGDVPTDAIDACTTVGAPFDVDFWEFVEQPEMRNSMPVDTNKATFFIIVSSQSVRR
jgi:hypothetical protein